MINSRRFGLALILAVVILSLGTAALADDLIVSAAASLTDVFKEMKTAFEKENKDTKVLFNFAASGTLASQIENGAPVDVFASASTTDMDRLQRHGKIDVPTRKTFAKNSIVLIVPENSKLKIKNVTDLRKDSVKRIAVGNPETTPGGRYAMQTFKKLNMTDAVQKKLIYGNDIRQVRTYVQRGELDAGFVFLTDKNAEGIKTVYEVPDWMHNKIIYPAAVVKGSHNKTAAIKFVEFLTSNEGRKILSKFGFKLPSK